MIIICMLFAYLLGSVSVSFIAGKLVAGVDIREHGSGNAGATNSLRVLGWKVGIVVLVADILKGVLAIAFAHLLTGDSRWAMAWSGLFAVIGHNWPVYFHFRGGKGVSTTIGVLLTLSAPPVLYAAVVAIALLLLTRYVSVASLVLVTLTPIFEIALHVPAAYIWISFILAVLTYWRHKSNIVRLVHGEESRLFTR